MAVVRVIGKIGLMPAQLETRKNFVGCSLLPTIVSGDDAAVMNAYQEYVGEKERDDLTWVMPVQLGNLTENMNCDFYEHETGNVITREGEAIVSKEYPWLRATLDGFIEALPGTFQAKHVNMMAKPDETVAKYWPQVTGEMICAGVDRCILSVFYGTFKYEYYELELDPFYAEAVIEKADVFWRAVQNREPPCAMPYVAPPVKPEDYRTVDMSESNSWASMAGDWLDSKAAATKFKKADKELRELVEPDVGLATGHGIQGKRTKAGALRLTEIKA